MEAGRWGEREGEVDPPAGPRKRLRGLSLLCLAR